MKIRKILVSLLLVFSILLLNTSSSFAIFGIEEKTKSSLVAEMENEIFFVSENIEEALPIASISKVMTYFVVRDAIENKKINMTDVVEISKTAANEVGSNIELKEGEKITIKDLIDGLMVVSGNDAAVALSEAVAGNEAEFAKLMNEKAKELGLEASTFTNASGLTKNGADNKMTAKDIFKMAKAVIEKYPEILEYSKTRILKQEARNFEGESTIPLVGTVEGVDGLKTGYTDEAGYCLVSTMKVKKGDSEFRLISVLMGAETKADRAQYTKDMLNYVKENIETKKIVDQTKFIKRIKINSSKQGYVDLIPEKDVDRITLKGINYNLEVDSVEIKLPLAKGAKVSELKVKNGDTILDTVNLVASEDYEKAGLISRFGRWAVTIFNTFETILP